MRTIQGYSVKMPSHDYLFNDTKLKKTTILFTNGVRCLPVMRVSLPPTIRSSMEDPQTPGAGKSLARKDTPRSPPGGMFGVWVTGGADGQQTCNIENSTKNKM